MKETTYSTVSLCLCTYRAEIAKR